MNKQTAVEWLVDRIIQDKKHNDISDKVWEDFFDKSLEMEKEQIKDAWNNGMKSDNGHFGTSNQYYNETYGGQDES
jgi:hypothetical protein